MAFKSTACVRMISSYIEQSPFAQKVLEWLWDTLSSATGSPRSPRHGHSIVASSRRQARKGGQNTLEATLIKFGLDEASLKAAQEEDKPKEETATLGTEETLKRSQREAGTDEVDDIMIEEKPELGVWDPEDLGDDEVDPSDSEDADEEVRERSDNDDDDDDEDDDDDDDDEDDDTDDDTLSRI